MHLFLFGGNCPPKIFLNIKQFANNFPTKNKL